MVHDIQTMTLGIRFFSFHITYSFSFFKGNGLKLSYVPYNIAERFATNFKQMYKKAIEV